MRVKSPHSQCCSHTVIVLWNMLISFVGPYSLNGVPLRRVNQRYVIATSTSVALDGKIRVNPSSSLDVFVAVGVDVSSIDDALFARSKKEEEGAGIDPARATAQATIDAALVTNIKKTEMLSAYMQAKFTLGKYDRPHLLKF